MAPLLCSPAVAEASGPSGLKSAVKLVESALQSDSAYPLLVDQFAAYGPLPSCSGLQDLDYPADPYCAAAPAPGASMVCRRVPLPAELAEQKRACFYCNGGRGRASRDVLWITVAGMAEAVIQAQHE
ncbi:hypothetical protein HPB52_019773 [Rhipicephalus sanguineus]|uniref:Uncharacterized protein n=1 Tax=Rhipicephalus sanguineus TaxID=34632 RepID=A0A9D4PK06_RHISA|nr:hypothetical protein HPB52_019773 [Rhipicephalus sanguineus]